MNEDVKKEIIEFLQQEKPCPDKASELILKHNVNKHEAQVFLASPSRYLMQMRWALAKLISISLVDFQRGYFTDFRKKEEKDYPAVIIRIKAELPKIFEQRSAIQKALTELGDANDEETRAKAKELGELATSLGIRHQLLHEAKELYFESDGKVVPDEAELFPETEDENEDNQESFEPKYVWVNDPVKAMQIKKNLESSLAKDRNRLKYQSPSAKDKQENPMPEGPERDKVEARIAEKEKELAAINDFLKIKDDAGKAE